MISQIRERYCTSAPVSPAKHRGGYTTHHQLAPSPEPSFLFAFAGRGEGRQIVYDGVFDLVFDRLIDSGIGIGADVQAQICRRAAVIGAGAHCRRQDYYED